jgi:hypothetical protein
MTAMTDAERFVRGVGPAPRDYLPTAPLRRPYTPGGTPGHLTTGECALLTPLQEDSPFWQAGGLQSPAVAEESLSRPALNLTEGITAS